jgi:hypothetical protein
MSGESFRLMMVFGLSSKTVVLKGARASSPCQPSSNSERD